MKKLGKSKDKISVGLDIGTHTIKIAKLGFVKDKAELCGFDLEPCQDSSPETLKKLVKSQGGIETVIRQRVKEG